MGQGLGRQVTRDLLILGYAATVGFVAGGIVASFYQMVTQERARFALLGSGAMAVVTTFLFFALTGPIIIMDRALKGRLKEKEPLTWLFGAVFIAALWSCCSGIFVLGFALSLGNTIS
jgi:hypothetical protein